MCACCDLVGVIRVLAVGSTKDGANKLKVVTCLYNISKILMILSMATYLAQTFSCTIPHSPYLAKITGWRRCLICRC